MLPFGPRQSARAIIPTIISQIAAGKKIVKVGDLRPTRDLTYVKDTCQGFIKLAVADNLFGETVNIGSNYEVSMGELFDLIKKIMNSNVSFEVEESRIRPDKSEVFRLWCDNSKIKKLTDFALKYNLERGLEETIEWFTNSQNLAKYKTEIYNV